jgi:hypothetical protein
MTLIQSCNHARLMCCSLTLASGALLTGHFSGLVSLIPTPFQGFAERLSSVAFVGLDLAVGANVPLDLLNRNTPCTRQDRFDGWHIVTWPNHSIRGREFSLKILFLSHALSPFLNQTLSFLSEAAYRLVPIGIFAMALDPKIDAEDRQLFTIFAASLLFTCPYSFFPGQHLLSHSLGSLLAVATTINCYQLTVEQFRVVNKVYG